jgi:hypothetical protein
MAADSEPHPPVPVVSPNPPVDLVDWREETLGAWKDYRFINPVSVPREEISSEPTDVEDRRGSTRS